MTYFSFSTSLLFFKMSSGIIDNGDLTLLSNNCGHKYFFHMLWRRITKICGSFSASGVSHTGNERSNTTALTTNCFVSSGCQRHSVYIPVYSVYINGIPRRSVLSGVILEFTNLSLMQVWLQPQQLIVIAQIHILQVIKLLLIVWIPQSEWCHIILSNIDFKPQIETYTISRFSLP